MNEAYRKRLRRENRLFVLGGIGVLAAILGITFVAVSARSGSPGDGYSVGTIVNVANHGVFWSRPEVYVLHTGEMKADDFGIEESLVSTAEKYSGTGVRVRVHYTEYLLCWAWNYANCAVIDGIEPEAQVQQ